MDKGNSLVRLVGVSVVALVAAGTALARDSERCEANTPGEIAGILLQGNQAQIQLGQAAALRAQDPDVKAFAQRLADDGYQANQALLQAIGQYNVPVEDSKVRRDIAEYGEDELKDFWRQEAGPDLDEVFLEVEIDNQQAALNFLDRTLIPYAQTTEMRDALTQEREMVAQHLDEARSLWERTMGQAPGGYQGQEPGGYEEQPGGMNKGEEEYGEKYGGEEGGGYERGNAPSGGERGGMPRQQPGGKQGGQTGGQPGGQTGGQPGGQTGGQPGGPRGGTKP
jgi:predicted outer membrane protein